MPNQPRASVIEFAALIGPAVVSVVGGCMAASGAAPGLSAQIGAAASALGINWLSSSLSERARTLAARWARVGHVDHDLQAALALAYDRALDACERELLQDLRDRFPAELERFPNAAREVFAEVRQRSGALFDGPALPIDDRELAALAAGHQSADFTATCTKLVREVVAAVPRATNGPDYFRFVEARLPDHTAVEFIEQLRSPSDTGTRAWRAFVRLQLADLHASMQRVGAGQDQMLGKLDRLEAYLLGPGRGSLVGELEAVTRRLEVTTTRLENVSDQLREISARQREDHEAMRGLLDDYAGVVYGRPPNARVSLDPTLDSESNAERIILSSADRYFRPEDLPVQLAATRFIIAVPDARRARLEAKKFAWRPQDVRGEADGLAALERQTAIPGLATKIEAHASRVAELIAGERAPGDPRFNGELYAPSHLDGNRTTVGEHSTVTFTMCTTDYFTYRVVRSVYQELRAQEWNFGFARSFAAVNRNLVLTPSLGVCGFLLVDDGSGTGDRVFLNLRSRGLPTDGGKWHYSVNEGFSSLDVDSADLSAGPSLATCMMRGFKEELGIRPQDLAHGTGRFTHLFVDVQGGGVGMLCHARLKLTSDCTLDDFLAGREAAPDSALESEGYRLLPLGGIPEFVAAHGSEVSPSCRWALDILFQQHKRRTLTSPA